MPLKFFGRGSGFSNEHTSAYFITPENEMVIIDCPVSTFQKVKNMDLTQFNEIYVLITHTHGDHVGGLGLLCQYGFFVLNKKISIICPSFDVAKDVSVLMQIEGNNIDWYFISTCSAIYKKSWFKTCIQVPHAQNLKGKCFGYNLLVDDKNVIYSGDTSSLKPFVKYLTGGSILYTDASVYYGQIHLKLEDSLGFLDKLVQKNIRVYLMHLDDVEAAEKLIENHPGISVVEI